PADRRRSGATGHWRRELAVAADRRDGASARPWRPVARDRREGCGQRSPLPAARLRDREPRPTRPRARPSYQGLHGEAALAGCRRRSLREEVTVKRDTLQELSVSDNG